MNIIVADDILKVEGADYRVVSAPIVHAMLEERND